MRNNIVLLLIALLAFGAFVGGSYWSASSKNTGPVPVSGDWVGVVRVSDKGSSAPAPEFNHGNTVVMLHLQRTLLTQMKQWHGTLLVDDGSGVLKEFNVAYINFNGGEFEGFLTGTKSLANDFGSIAFTMAPGELMLNSGLSTMNRQMQGTLKPGTRADFNQLERAMHFPALKN